jgi:hypothetical protein
MLQLVTQARYNSVRRRIRWLSWASQPGHLIVQLTHLYLHLLQLRLFAAAATIATVRLQLRIRQARVSILAAKWWAAPLLLVAQPATEVRNDAAQAPIALGVTDAAFRPLSDRFQTEHAAANSLVAVTWLAPPVLWRMIIHKIMRLARAEARQTCPHDRGATRKKLNNCML